MREIKFRVWDEKETCMWQVDGLVYTSKGMQVNSVSVMHPCYDDAEPDEWHRSKGIDNIINEVVYDSSGLGYTIGENGIFFKRQLNNNVEVIGNIHENKDLL